MHRNWMVRASAGMHPEAEHVMWKQIIARLWCRECCHDITTLLATGRRETLDLRFLRAESIVFRLSAGGIWGAPYPVTSDEPLCSGHERPR